MTEMYISRMWHRGYLFLVGYVHGMIMVLSFFRLSCCWVWFLTIPLLYHDSGQVDNSHELFLPNSIIWYLHCCVAGKVTVNLVESRLGSMLVLSIEKPVFFVHTLLRRNWCRHIMQYIYHIIIETGLNVLLIIFNRFDVKSLQCNRLFTNHMS